MLQRGLLLLVVIGLLVAGLLVGQARQAPLVVSGLVEAEEVRVGSRVGGRVKAVQVREGDTVQPGAVLVTLEPWDLQERLAQGRAELKALEAQLARLVAGSRPEELAAAQAQRDEAAAFLAELQAGPRKQEVEVARAGLRLAEAELELAESERTRVSALAREGAARQDQLDAALSRHKEALAQLAARKEELALLEEGTRPERIAQAQARLRAAEAELALVTAGPRAEDKERARQEVAAAEARVGVLEKSLSELDIVAPAPRGPGPREERGEGHGEGGGGEGSGAVVSALDLYPGDLVAANAPVVALRSGARMWVRAYVPAPLLVRVKEGTRLAVRVDGVQGALAGEVTFVAAEAEFVPQNVQTPDERQKQVFRVEVTLPDAQARGVRPGMSADVDLEHAAP